MILICTRVILFCDRACKYLEMRPVDSRFCFCEEAYNYLESTGLTKMRRGDSIFEI
jgi:hypothetical protein